MTPSITLIQFAREMMVALFDDLSVAQANAIPNGFNNNLIWNLGHVIAVQQALCYKRAGRDTMMVAALMELYQKGTKPDAAVDATGIAHLKTLAITTAAQLQRDYEGGTLSAYTPFTVTARNLPVNTIDDALAFTAYHEGLHLGTAQGIAKAVRHSLAA